MALAEAGGTYYAITHAYYHFVFEVVQMLGPQRAEVKNVRMIVSDPRGWTAFFRDGIGSQTQLHPFPDAELSWIDIFRWEHPIP